MAVRPEHDPKNRTVRARLKKAWKKAGAREAFGYIPPIVNPFNTQYRDVPDTITTVFGGALIGMGFIGNFLIGLDVPEYREYTKFVPPAQDEQIVFSPELADNYGYVAVSSNNGRSGYALFNSEGAYRLYQFSSQTEGERLTLVDNADDAWRISQSLSQNFGQLDEALDGQGDITTIAELEVIELPNLSLYAENESGDIVRYSDPAIDYDEQNGWPLTEQYSDMQQVWHEAAAHFAQSYASIPADEFAERAGTISNETVQVKNDHYDNEMMIGHILSGIGGALFALSAVPPIIRRRRHLKDGF